LEQLEQDGILPAASKPTNAKEKAKQKRHDNRKLLRVQNHGLKSHTLQAGI
jgi:hypothetical protein